MQLTKIEDLTMVGKGLLQVYNFHRIAENYERDNAYGVVDTDHPSMYDFHVAERQRAKRLIDEVDLAIIKLRPTSEAKIQVASTIERNGIKTLKSF